MVFLFIVIAIGVFLPPVTCDIESGYKGITVFETNRKDVERYFGKAKNETTHGITFENEEVRLDVVFSEERCGSKDRTLTMFNVPEGTVLQYSLIPKKETPIGDLKWKTPNYTRVPIQATPRIVEYINPDVGIIVVTNLSNLDQSETLRTIYYQRPQGLVEKYKCLQLKRQ